MDGLILLSDEEFERFRSLIYAESGIALSEPKGALLVSRLSRRLRELGLASFTDYYNRVVADPTREELTRMLDLISTNKTEFFREPGHFEFLRNEILPTLNANKRARIWSAGCSTGEEPYTIGITLYEAVPNPEQWDLRILASDLSTRVLSHAAAGIYEAERIASVPPEIVKRHFLKGRGDRAGFVMVKPHLKKIVQFRRINLMDERFPIKTPLDVIFCRNVMIYFDRPTQERVVAKFHRYLNPGGYLFIGHSETLQWVRHPFRPVVPTIYRKET